MGTEKLFDDQGTTESKAYEGRLGRTTFESVLWTAPDGRILSVRVYTAVNAATDPVLADRFLAGTLNWIRYDEDERLYPVRCPVVYHDPARRLFVLVLPEEYRTRELEERARLLQALAEDKTNPVPEYVLRFQVVYGEAGLADLVGRESPGRVEVTPVRHLPPEYFRSVEPQEKGAGDAFEVLGADEARAVLQADADEILKDMGPSPQPTPDQEEDTVVRPAPSGVGRDLLDLEPEEMDGGTGEAPMKSGEALEEGAGDLEESAVQAPTSSSEMRESLEEGDAEEAREEEEEPVQPVLPPALAGSPDGRYLFQEEGVVVLQALVEPDQARRFLGRDAVVWIQLHRMPTCPVAVLAAMPPDERHSAVFWFLDLLSDEDLGVLEALIQDFRVRLELYDSSGERRYTHRAHYPLEENAKLVQKKAMEQLTQLGEEEPDFEAAKQAWNAPDFPRMPKTDHGFTARSFEKLETPQQAATALGIVEWWAAPAKEEELLLVHSFPVVWWRRILQRVIRAGLKFGLWPPGALLEHTLAGGYATSRRDLVRQLLDRFVATVSSGRSDLDVAQEDENWKVLLEEAAQAGIVPGEEAERLAKEAAARMESARGRDISLPETPEDYEPLLEPEEQGDEAIALDDSDLEEFEDLDGIDQEVRGEDGRALTPEELVALLEPKDTRLRAALMLAKTRDPEFVEVIFDAARRMTRSEVVRLLPHLVAYGAAAEPFFVEFLDSNKSFLRQGAALALGILRSRRAVQALVEKLIAEPTGIWKELARVLGEMGEEAFVQLLESSESATGEVRDRIAYALAHVAVSAGRRDLVESLQSSEDSMQAALGRRALELVPEAQAAVKAYEEPEREDSSVVVAFTRTFLEGLEQAASSGGEDQE